jgi:tetratricopeptide (TPR) repeat protein
MPSLHEVQLCHAIYYLDVAWQTHRLYEEGGESINHALALFDMEWCNIQVGQAWAASNAKQDDGAAKICSNYLGAGTLLLDRRLHPHERIPWLEAALSSARKIRDHVAEVAHLCNLGIAYRDVGEIHHGIEYHEQQLRIAREHGAERSQSNALANLRGAYKELGEIGLAIECSKQSLLLASKLGDKYAEGCILGDLGEDSLHLGEIRQAIEYYERYRDISRETGDRRGEGTALGNLGAAYAILGETRRAIELYEQHREISHEIGDHLGEGNALSNMSRALNKLGERAQAIAYAEAAVEIFQQIGNPNAPKLRQKVEEWYGEGLSGRQAVDHFQQMLARARAVDDKQLVGSILGKLGDAYADVGEMEQAIEHYEQALTIVRELGDRVNEWLFLSRLGLAHEFIGEDIRRKEGPALAILGRPYTYPSEMRRAIEYYEEALGIAREVGIPDMKDSILQNMNSTWKSLEEWRTQGLAMGRLSANKDILDWMESIEKRRNKKWWQFWK